MALKNVNIVKREDGRIIAEYREADRKATFEADNMKELNRQLAEYEQMFQTKVHEPGTFVREGSPYLERELLEDQEVEAAELKNIDVSENAHYRRQRVQYDELTQEDAEVSAELQQRHRAAEDA